jgi:hypothetical protein
MHANPEGQREKFIRHESQVEPRLVIAKASPLSLFRVGLISDAAEKKIGVMCFIAQLVHSLQSDSSSRNRRKWA